MEKQNKILVIGDIHLKENLGYSQYVKDGRASEKQEILDFIVEQSTDCNTVVFMGDQLNGRNNPSDVIRELVEFIERFNGKKIFIISGNHEKSGDGKTAIDFLKEINNKDWTIITNEIKKVGDLTFCPYFNKSELGVKTDLSATKKIMEQLEKNDMLFVHHAVSGTTTTSGVETTIFHEPILPKKELEKLFKLVVGSHIHSPQADGRTIVAGSIFNQEAGEHGKFIWKIGEKLSVEQIPLPGRGIYKFENPTPEDLVTLRNTNIVKVIMTTKGSKEALEEIRKELEKFDASLLLEQYPSERKKMAVADNILDYDTVKLLEVYSVEKQIDINKLRAAFALIQ